MNSSISAPPAGDVVRAQYLPVSEARAGMCLAETLLLVEQQRVLFSLPAGTMLTEEVLARLTQRGADVVCVLSPETRSPAQQEADKQTARERLDRIFANANLEEPDTRALMECLYQYRITVNP